MRTTVTLDPDTERLLREAMQQTGHSFKVTLNEALRKGLADTVVVADEEPFVVKAKNMGLRPGIDPTKLQQLADEMEVEAYLEVTRQLEARRAQSSTS
jgi:hypothetical protein